MATFDLLGIAPQEGLPFWVLGGGVFVFGLALARYLVHIPLMPAFNKRRNVLILGVTDSGMQIACEIRANPHGERQLVGFLDDSGKSSVLGPLADYNKVLATRHIDEVIIALPIESLDIEHLHGWLFPNPCVDVWLCYPPHAANIQRGFGGMAFRVVRAHPLSPLGFAAKRIFDIIFSILVLVFLSVPMLAIAVLIRLDSPGPVLFLQKRVGFRGREFQILKFRTMVENAETMRGEALHLTEDGQEMHKHAGDPRITRLGRFLRRLSLDELPQFINVLRGEMSVVGPRPELPYIVESYAPWQFARLTVPQGITGWWQVNGRSDRPMHLNTEFDLYYVENISLGLDLEIIFRTFAAVIKMRGAY